MDDLVERLDKWLAENRPDYYSKLEPGLSGEELADLEATLEVALPPEMRALLMWRNGQNARNSHSIYHNYMFIGSDDIADIFAMNNDMLDNEEFDKANWWHHGWVPFLDNGAGDYYCVDFAGSFDGVPGQVLEFNHDYEGRTIQYPSLRQWLETLVQ